MPSIFGEAILAPQVAPLPDRVLEANHRIANNLSIIAALIRSELLTLSKYATDPGYTRRLLQQMSLRIDAVARLHRLLMDTSHSAIVELGAYLQEIVDAATCSLTNSARTRIVCKFEGRTTVSAKQAAGMGLFVSEALVNSIKHAHRTDESGTICVSCRRSERGSLLIEIMDDGVGLPSSFRACPKSETGAGARLMLSIAHDLGAYLTFAKRNPGQIVRLEIPPADQDAAIVGQVAAAELEVRNDYFLDGHGTSAADRGEAR
jgi:two-component sensor histidine kinase